MPRTPSNHSDLVHELRKRIDGDLLFDRMSRVLYSTDASNFQVEPLGVVLPRNEDEICAVIEIAQLHQTQIIARGSGSSMAGQTLGPGIILDCSKYLNKIHSVDVESGTAIVGPGVILNTLNRRVAPDSLMFGPDPASAERATFGGMIGNNATGAHSIRYGLVIDHILDAEVVLSDGSITRFEPLSESGFEQRQALKGLEGAIYSTVNTVRSEYSSTVREQWPGTWRRASGYSLNYLTGYSPGQPPGWHDPAEAYPPTAGLNLTPLLVGSEGTLAVIRQATINLVRVPQAKILVILAFESVEGAAEATPGLLELDPDAIELIPRSIFDRARQIPSYARKMGFLEGNPAAILVVEFSGQNPADALKKARQIQGGLILERAESQADLWAVRKVGLGLLMSIPGDTKPITFIEDVAVPVERLAEFVRKVNAVLSDHKTYGEWYAHASAGCLHLRPMVNLKTDQGVTQMGEIAEAVIDITLTMRGSISGEHGDGLSHTEYNERMFGPVLMGAFRRIKDSFDPYGILNPGKVIPANDGFGGPGSLTSNLRYGPDYRAHEPLTIMNHNREGGFTAAVEACTGVGVCRQEHGLMCPSYQVTRDEVHTTRGRANALRAALSGQLPPGSLTSKDMFQVLDLCIECKGCKAECPTAVDMARIKAEFLHMYQQEHGVPLRSRLFANIHQASALIQPMSAFVALMAALPPTRWAQQALLGISSRRELPLFARRTFTSVHRKSKPLGVANPPRVILFLDTYTQYIQPEIGHDAVFILDKLGIDVDIVEGQVCCGRPMISKGMLEMARTKAAINIEVLGREAMAGVPIMGIEPSCLLTLRDEYLELFPGDQRAEALARNSFLFEEFLLRENGESGRWVDALTPGWSEEAVSFHNHCYSKALVGSTPLAEVYRTLAVSAAEIPSGCCGMAGSFGYEAEHYDLSMKVAEQVLLPSVRDAAAAGNRILAPGYSCRTQIRDGCGEKALHPIQHIAALLRADRDIGNTKGKKSVKT